VQIQPKKVFLRGPFMIIKMNRLVAAIVITLSFVACKKSDNNVSTDLPGNTWKVDTATYQASSVFNPVVSGKFQIIANTARPPVGSSLEQLAFTFNSSNKPTAGAYKVVSQAQFTGSAGEVVFYVGVIDPAKATYVPTDGTQTANVTIEDDGAVTIKTTDLKVKSIATGSMDSAKVSCNITWR
jgi:hypothetical protein